jgi:MFS family permease
MFLFAGWGNLIWQPIALTFGRRGVFLLSSVLTLGPMVWTVYTGSAAIWYGHRILIGAICAPVESLGEVSVSDLFFAHERGNYMGIYTLLVFGSNALAPFFSGFIANSLGWKAPMWFGIINLGVTTLILFFGLEETMYFRKEIEGVDEGAPEVLVGSETVDEKGHPVSKDAAVDEQPASPVIRGSIHTTKQTYWQKLRPFRSVPGRPTVKQMFYMMIRPLIMFFYFPNVIWAGFLYGASLCWYQVQNATMALILGDAPYHFSSNMVGVSYLSLFIGCCLAWWWSGWAGDRLAIILARRNKGIREPEHRLWLLLVSGIISTAGMILWGVGASQKIHFMGLEIGMAMVSFGVVSGGNTALAYDVDCFKEIAGESLVLVIVIRNTMGFGMSYGITPWLDNTGIQNTFVAVAFLVLICNLSFLLMTVWGKKLRRMSAKKYWEYVDTLIISAY